MHRRYNLAYFILALSLMMQIIGADAQAQIAFMSKRDGNWQIYVMDIDGNNQRRLTNNRDNDYAPSWSPDGKRIVFSSNRDGDLEIYVMDADGSNPQNLTNNDFYDTHPSWSPDGKRIAFISRRDGHFIGEDGITSEIYVMDTDGGNQHRLTENRQNDWEPVWSPDGKRIAFASDRKGDHENFEIYVMDADGSNPRNLTNNPHYDASPAWFNGAFAVAPAGKILTMWGWLKQAGR